MMSLLKFSLQLSQRVIILYVLFFVLSGLLVSDVKIKRNTLNTALPQSFDYFIKFTNGEESFDNKNFEPYFLYYKKLVEVFPQRADSHGMVGYCYYYKGQESRAIKAFHRAIEINPYFLPFHYNLGIIYFRHGQYREAMEAFQKSLEPDIAFNLKFIAYAYKIYQPFLKGMTPSEVEAKVKDNITNSYKMLVMSAYQLKDYELMFQSAFAALKDNIDADVFFYYYAGLGAYELKHYDKAALFLKRFLALNSNHTDALYYLAMSMKDLGREDMSSETLNKLETLHNASAMPPLIDPGKLMLLVF